MKQGPLGNISPHEAKCFIEYVDTALTFCSTSTISRHESIPYTRSCIIYVYSIYVSIFSFSRHLLVTLLLNLSLIGCWWGTGQVTLLRWVASLSVSACHEEYPVTLCTSYQSKDLTKISFKYINRIQISIMKSDTFKFCL